MKTHRIILTNILLIACAFSVAHSQNLGTGRSLNRKKALVMLKGCNQSLSSEGCNDDTAEYLIGLYKHGDKTLLPPLLDAGLVSDGALSESLGSFYGELLRKAPREFLTSLVSRPKSEQHKLAWLAGAMDGGGMPKETLQEVKAKLRKIVAQKRNRLSSVARLCLSEVNKVNKLVR